MKFTVLIGEVRRNITSGTARMGLGFCVTVVMIMLSVADVVSIAWIQNDADQFQRAAAVTRVLVAPGEIVPRACDNLAGVGTILASGAIAEGPLVSFQAMPTVRIQSFRVTPGFAGVVGIDDPAPRGVWIDEGLATALGAQTGMVLPTNRGDLHIAGVFSWPQDGRDQRLTFTVLSPEAPTRDFDECWMKAWPIVDSNDVMLRTSQQAGFDSQSLGMISQVNKAYGVALDAHHVFITRVTRFAPIVLLLAGMGLGFAIARSRRLEYASALHAGQTKTDQLGACLLETSAWAFPAAFVAGVVRAAVVTALNVSGGTSVMMIVIREPIMGVSGSLVGAMLGCALTREKDLFKLFKSR